MQKQWDVVKGCWVGGEYDLSPEARIAYYDVAYQHGQEAFERGEAKEAVSKHYGEGVIYGTLGVRGWRDGWVDAYRRTVTDLWWDNASYAAYQSQP
jgi:hypothetical protein